MRSYLKFITGAWIAIGSVAPIVGLYMMANGELWNGIYLVAGGFASIVFSGTAWMIIEIADKVAPEERLTLRNATTTQV